MADAASEKYKASGGHEPKSEDFWARVVKSGACWDWTGSTTADGYGRLGFGKSRVLAHRFSWELHFGEIPKRLKVLHRCDNPPCTNPKHLFLGTDQDNSNDKMRKGRDHKPRGDAHPQTKLPDARVPELRAFVAAYGYGGKVAASRKFHLSLSQVSAIFHGRSRK